MKIVQYYLSFPNSLIFFNCNVSRIWADFKKIITIRLYGTYTYAC